MKYYLINANLPGHRSGQKRLMNAGKQALNCFSCEIIQFSQVYYFAGILGIQREHSVFEIRPILRLLVEAPRKTINIIKYFNYLNGKNVQLRLLQIPHIYYHK